MLLLSGKNIVGREEQLATEYLRLCLLFADEAREKEGFEERLQGSKMQELSQTPPPALALALAAAPGTWTASKARG